MLYETNTKRVNDYFFNKIYPNMGLCGIEYNKTIFHISSTLAISRGKVEEFIKDLVESGKLQEIRILELPKEELVRREKVKEEIEKEVKKEEEGKI